MLSIWKSNHSIIKPFHSYKNNFKLGFSLNLKHSLLNLKPQTRIKLTQKFSSFIFLKFCSSGVLPLADITTSGFIVYYRPIWQLTGMNIVKSVKRLQFPLIYVIRSQRNRERVFKSYIYIKKENLYTRISFPKFPESYSRRKLWFMFKLVKRLRWLDKHVF